MQNQTFAQIKGNIHKWANGVESAPAQALRLFVYSVDHALQHGNKTLISMLHEKAKPTYKKAFREAAQVLGFSIDEKSNAVFSLKKGQDLGNPWKRIQVLAALKTSVNSKEFKSEFMPGEAAKAEESKAKKEAEKAQAEAQAQELLELREKVEKMGGNVDPVAALREAFAAMDHSAQAVLLAELQAIHHADADADADADAVAA